MTESMLPKLVRGMLVYSAIERDGQVYWIPIGGKQSLRLAEFVYYFLGEG